MCKKDHGDLMKSLRCLDLQILVNEIKRDVMEHFPDGFLSKFVKELLENDEPMLEIAGHHRDSFVHLYQKCKLLKSLSMEFQRQRHVHCSAFLLEEKYKLVDIDLEESDCNNATLVAIRNVWLGYYKDHDSPVPASNPIMMTISARAYFYLLDQVTLFQNELSAKESTGTQLTSDNDGDDVFTTILVVCPFVLC